MDRPKQYHQRTTTIPDIAEALALTEQAGANPIRLRRATSMTRKVSRRQVRFLKALDAHEGVVTYAERETGIHRQSHYRWMKDYPDYVARVEELNLEERLIDKAEQAVHNALELSDSRFTADRALALNAAALVLKTKGKKRGWAEAPSTAVQVNQGFTLKIVTEADDAGKPKQAARTTVEADQKAD